MAYKDRTSKDFPLEACAAEAAESIKAGFTVHQKFTCAKCGSRQTMSEPNKFFTSGTCEECQHVTDIKARGCNYLMIAGV